MSAELAEREDELENRQLAARVTFKGEEMPLRNAQAQLAVLPSYADREELGEIQAEASAQFNADRLELMRAGEDLAADYSGIADPIERNEEEKAISLHELSKALKQASDAGTESFGALRERWFARLLGDDRPRVPSSYHTAYMRRLSPLESTYTKDRATEICLQTLEALGFDMNAQPNIKLDLDDRPQKSPRACVIASDPPTVVHLITRAQGGLHDYQAFLHEAGHALHYAGCDPDLPYTFRRISRDHALTEIYSYIVEAISREPEWHELYFGLVARAGARERRGDDVPRGAALSPLRGEAALRARLLVAVQRRRRRCGRLRAAAHRGDGHPLPQGQLPLGHGCRVLLGRLPPRLDPLCAAARTPDRHRGRRLVAQSRHRRPPARLFREGTKPTSEEIAGRLGFDPFDTAPLLHEIGV